MNNYAFIKIHKSILLGKKNSRQVVERRAEAFKHGAKADLPEMKADKRR
jgi:hypothetical protein